MSEETLPAPAPVTPQWSFGMPTPRLNKALSLLHGDLPKITKNKTGEIKGQNKNGEWYAYDYKYADLADIAEAVDPLMAKYGLAFTAAPMLDPADRDRMILAWSLLHESGEERSGDYPLGPANQKPQALGSMLTYARRYSKTTALDIVAEEDDDGRRAQALSRSSNGRESAASAFDNATAAQPRRSNGTPGNDAEPPQQQDGPPVPPPLDPADPWALLIADIKTPEDADAAEAQLRKAWEAGEINDQRTHQVKHWIRVKAAPMRTAAQSAPRPSGNTAAEPSGDEKWAGEFRSRLVVAAEDALTPMLGEVGRAVGARTITPDQGSVLSGEVRQRRRMLQEQAAAEAAAEATEATAA